MPSWHSRKPLHHRLFWWSGFTIFLTTLVAAGAVHLFRPNQGWHHSPRRLDALTSRRFEQLWDNTAARNGLARDLGEHLDVAVALRDPKGKELYRHGEACSFRPYEISVVREGREIGKALACFSTPRRSSWIIFIALGAAGLTLWLASGMLARRLTRPLRDLRRVTAEIGEGKLSSRVRLCRHQPDEVGDLAESINDMAKRIEKQLADQRELLAGVSHEIRTPLARMRLLIEMLRDAPSPEHADKLEEEVLEIDDLVGQLLASSRLEFAALSLTELQGAQVAARALERAGLAESLLEDSSRGALFMGDATLLGRALANLLDNARRYGSGVEALRVSQSEGWVSFEVMDRGPGFGKLLDHAFEPFRHHEPDPGTEGRTALGLGLSLVRRIARAHGGEAFAENRDSEGARVGIRVPAMAEAGAS